MYPLKSWTTLRNGYIFRQRTWYTRYHLGLDKIAPAWTKVYAPFDGKIVASGKTAVQGNYVHYRANHDSKKLFRLMHLIQRGHGVGNVKEGEIIGYIGSTGLSSGNHLHVDSSVPNHNIYNINLFINPATYNWNWKPTTPPPAYPKVVIAKEPAWVRSSPRILNDSRGRPTNLSGSRELKKGDRFVSVGRVKGDCVGNNCLWEKSKFGNYVHTINTK